VPEKESASSSSIPQDHGVATHLFKFIPYSVVEMNAISAFLLEDIKRKKYLPMNL